METTGINSITGYYLKWYISDRPNPGWIEEALYIPCNLSTVDHKTIKCSGFTIVPGILYEESSLNKWVVKEDMKVYLPFVSRFGNCKYKYRTERSVESLFTNVPQDFVMTDRYLQRDSVSGISEILRHFNWMLEILNRGELDEDKTFTLLDTREIAVYSEKRYILPVL